MSTSPLNFEERLAHHPELQQRFEHILQIAEARGDQLQRADEVELQVIESVRQLGHDVLTAWARQRINDETTQSAADPALRPYGKKNSTGSLPTG